MSYFQYIKPLIIYGWNEGNSDYVICDEWLKNNNIKKYASEIVETNVVEAIYGLPCNNNIIYENDRENIEDSYEKINIFKKNNNYPITHLGYFIALEGNSHSISYKELKKYIPTN